MTFGGVALFPDVSGGPCHRGLVAALVIAVAGAVHEASKSSAGGEELSCVSTLHVFVMVHDAGLDLTPRCTGLHLVYAF